MKIIHEFNFSELKADHLISQFLSLTLIVLAEMLISAVALPKYVLFFSFLTFVWLSFF